MGKLLKLLLLLAAIVLPTAAFLAPKVHSSSAASALGKPIEAFTSPPLSTGTSLSLSKSPGGKSNRNHAFPKARTDIRIFLTQRSIQSFVYLLNQCREDHTVRWLEKTLDFPSIDNFHGTGAFNQTKFPEWDSIFLECVDRPEEVMVLQMRQRRRQQKLSGHNEYFESLNSSSASSSTTSSTKSSPKEAGTKPGAQTTHQAFSTTNYLDAMKPTTKQSSAAAEKKSAKPKITNRKLSGSSNYLDNLSSSPAPPKTALKSTKNISFKKPNEKGPRSKDRGEQKDEKVVCDTKNSKDGEEGDSSEKPKKNHAQRRIFAPGKSSSYLESLSTISNATTSGESSPSTAEKGKQSTETSKNPFLEEKSKEYELSIDPPALVRRMLSIREQISKEWVEDLDMLIKLNDEIAESFEEYNNKAEAKVDDDDDDVEEDNLKVDNVDRKAEDSDGEDGGKRTSDLDSLFKALGAPADKDSKPELSSKSSSAQQAVPGDEKRQNVFDRSILSTWSQTLWSPNRSSSPYRKANFDLLLLLATQESIHRVLNSYKNDDTVRPQTHEWLLDFYVDNVNEYFDGHQTYARSEDFLEEMSKSPRTLIETNNDILAWTDPAIVAEDIVRDRSEVILNWMRVAETILDEHTDLRRLLFTNMVSKSFPDDSLSDTILTAVNITTVKNAAEEDSTSSPTEVFGAFE